MSSIIKTLKIQTDSYKVLDSENTGDGNSKENELNNLSKINIFVGENNSGKSRFLRNILENELEMILFEDFFSFPEFTKRMRQFFKDIEGIRDYRQIIDASHYPMDKYEYSNFIGNTDRQNLLSLVKGIGNTIQQKKKKKETYMPSSQASVSSVAGDVESKFKKLEEHLLENNFNFVAKDGLKKIYIPVLRSLIAINSLKEENSDYYQKRIKSDYFKDVSEDIDIFTGLQVYSLVKDYLLGDLNQRKLVGDYEQFLSEHFFNNKPITLIPKKEDIDLTIKIGDEEERPIYKLGDGIQSIIILTMPLFLNSDKRLLVFVEEPEKLIHPGLQRKLIDTLLNNKILSKNQYFITTHSNHFLDITLDYNDISIYRVKKNLDDSDNQQKKATFEIENLSSGDRSALEILGVRNSSVFLSNCTIWVEGITDRLYFKKYLELFMKEQNRKIFQEDFHYSFVEYSGGNITHWSFLDKDGENESMNAERICSRLFLITDKDERKDERHNKLEECLGNRYCCLECIEVENLIKKDILIRILIEEYGEPSDNLNVNFSEEDYKNEKIGKFIDIEIIKMKERGKRITEYAEESGTIKSKVSFCEKALKQINNYEDLSEEAKKIAEDLYNFIESNNN